MTKEESLFVKYQPLAHKIARLYIRKVPANIQFGDIYSASLIGLWKAIKDGKLNTEKSPLAFIKSSINWSIADELRKQDWLPKRLRAKVKLEKCKNPLPQILKIEDLKNKNVDINNLSNSESSCEVESILIELENEILTLNKLKKAINDLPEKRRSVIKEYYFNNRLMKDIGKELGISEARVSQLRIMSIQNLKLAMTSENV